MLAAALALPAAGQAPVAPKADITELSPEQLASLEITSVSRKPEKRWKTAAAIHVITRDDIRRSGATTLVEALRLAPGIQVARQTSSQWAVGVRGFASRLSRSLLVLIDGRSVYTPLFAGTYWEVQDLLLEDVERIEVIRGPGGTLWGSNAVNGVINIITRSSRDSQGTFATAGGGTDEHGFLAARHGGRAGDRLSYRVYGKAFDRGPLFHADGADFDAWRMFQGGFRADWERGAGDSLTVQADAYGGAAGQRTSITTLDPPGLRTVLEDSDLSGANLLGRFSHVSAGGAEWSLGAYYDRTDRRDPNFEEARDTFDLDVQRRAAYGRHDLSVGLGYRVSRGVTGGVPTVEFLPARRTDRLWTGFVRADLTLAGGELVATPGVKMEHNDYSGFEVQPALRLAWTPSGSHTLWTALTRAVRTPSRVEHDLSLLSLVEPRTPTFSLFLGSRDFRSEATLSAQLGYRARAGARLSLDLAGFYNDHRDLLSVEPGTPFRETSPPPARLVVPVRLANGIEGSSYGAELAAAWTPSARWRVAGWYSFLRLSLRPSPGSRDASTARSTNGGAPRHSASLFANVELPRQVGVDVMARLVDELPAQPISGYLGLDVRLSWRATPALEVALVGQNLASARHGEFAAGGRVAEVRRGFYAGISWRR